MESISQSLAFMDFISTTKRIVVCPSLSFRYFPMELPIWACRARISGLKLPNQLQGLQALLFMISKESLAPALDYHPMEGRALPCWARMEWSAPDSVCFPRKNQAYSFMTRREMAGPCLG